MEQGAEGCGMNVPESLCMALKLISARLEGYSQVWLVGGSTALLLHGIALSKQPGDLDLYVDENRVPDIYKRLRDSAVDEPHYSETNLYRSYLSHYAIEGVQVELVGGFRVITDGASYQTDIEGTLVPYASKRTIGSYEIMLTPLAHEFVFNILRDRPDRFEPIARRMRLEADRMIPAMQAIIRKNHFDHIYLQLFSELLDYSFM